MLNPKPLAEADAWLRAYERFWNSRLDLLEAALPNDDPLSSQDSEGDER